MRAFTGKHSTFTKIYLLRAGDLPCFLGKKERGPINPMSLHSGTGIPNEKTMRRQNHVYT